MLRSWFIATAIFTLGLPIYAADRFDGVTIKIHKLSETIFMLEGAGGNIGVSSGADGILMIDDQFAPLADRIKAALKTLGGDSPKYVLNTHYHGDHTGSNAAFGQQSTIVAHHNVRTRLIAEDKIDGITTNPLTLPVFTYQSQASIYFNDEEVRLLHMPSGHTDGDSVVHFTSSNIIHMGDHFFKDRFPYIDIAAGGSISGMITNIKTILKLVDDKTQIIPGHGDMAKRADIERYLDMLESTQATVKQAIENGTPMQQVIKQGLGDQWQSWGAGFVNEARWIETLFNSIPDQSPKT